MSGKKHLIVFVCTGNVCRSPMAEYLFLDSVGRDGCWEACSAGLSASYGTPASAEAVAVLKKRGIDLRAHSSRPLTPELASAADLIVAMTARQVEEVQSRYPDAAGKVRLMKSFDPAGAGEDIPDPIGLTMDMYERVCNEIAGVLPGLASYIEGRQD